jgi:ABC-type multidrug transport system ATPase subunit
MGPSGSGKSTLLNILADRLSHSRGSSLSGVVAAQAALGPLAFIPQDLAFFAHLTVEETLTLAAQLRRGCNTGSDGVSLEVTALLHRLGLSECAHSLVGGDAGGRCIPGISGGERRRLAIACETAGCGTGTAGERPRIIFADEPTAGLDAFHADRVVDALCELAHGDGCCVVAVIHQPRSASFARLDDVLLLAPGGRVAYAGPASGALAHFAAAGFPCPPHFNPAEHLVDLVSIDTTSPAREAETQRICDAVCAVWAQRRGADAPPAEHKRQEALQVHAPEERRPLGPFRVFGLLLQRAARIAVRDVWVNSTRLGASLVLGLAFGGMHNNMGRGQKAVAKRASLLMQCCINTAFLAMVKSLNGFPRERAVVTREVQRGTGPGGGGYGVVPYFLAKLCVDAPLDALFPLLFGTVTAHLAGLNPLRRGHLLATLALQGWAASSLGLSVSALAPSTESALALGPCLMVLSIMLADSGGVFAEVPPALRPLAKLSIVKWGFEGAMGSEFPGLEFTCDDLALPAQPKPDAKPDAKRPPNRKPRLRLPQLPNMRNRAAGAAARAAAEAMCVRNGEAVLSNMGLPPDGGVGRAATAQLRAVAVNLGVTLLALVLAGKGGGNSKRRGGGIKSLRDGQSSAGFVRTTLGERR